MPAKISAYLFDMDGTLTDTEILWVYACEDYMASKGLFLSHEDSIAIVCGRAWTSIYQDFVSRFPSLASISIRQMSDGLRPFYLARRDAGDIRIQGSIALVKSLSAHTPCVVVSGSQHVEVGETMRIIGLTENLAFYLGCEDYARGKPAPDGFLAAAEALGVPPAECVVFEDSSAGIHAAKAAGMRAVALVRPEAPFQDVSGADLILSDLSMFTPESLQ